MTWPRGERLYHRLPEIHRFRDRQQGEPLRALLAIAESQLEALEDDIAALYENWFIETCQDWAVPYLADLLGLRTLGELSHAGAHPRTQVANALAYRQRKGTPAILERVARDVTGWPARVVEMFERLAHTQAMGHLRPGQGGLFDVRRGTAALAEAESPFAPPSVFRTADVRRISSHRGRFNIPNLGLYLWRLKAFPLDDSPTASAPDTGGLGFTFDPLGRDVPLFNRLAPAEELGRQAAETDLPVPLLLPSLDRDLQGYRRRFAGLPKDGREPASGFYGAGRAFEITRKKESGTGREAVPPLEVVARNLDTWGAVGLLSGTFAAPPSLTAARPEVAVTLAGDGPYTARLGRRPTSLGDAAALLEGGLRAAHRSPRFAAARVIELGNRLLVLSGSPGDRVEIAATAGDTTSAGELRLTTGAAPGQGALSSVLAPFPALPDASPELTVRFGAGAPLAVTLAAAPTDLESARRLLDQKLQPSGARVLVLGERLLIVGPDPAAPVRVSRNAAGGADDADPAADLLGLAWTVAVDPERGRLLFAEAPLPAALPVRAAWAYGSAADMGGGPYDRRATLTDPATVLTQIAVRKGSAVPSLPAALASWVAAGRPSAVIRIADSDLYEEGFAFTLPRGVRLAIEAADGERPVLRPAGRPAIVGSTGGSTGGGAPGTLVLNGLLVDGGLDLAGGLELRITHSTLVPRPGRPSLTFVSTAPADNAAELSVHVSSSIVGALAVPRDIAALEIEDSILDAATSGDGGAGGAQPLPVLVSGPLPGALGLASRLEMNVSFAGRAPVLVRLRKAPADLEEARAFLQEALRDADPSAAFAGAEVVRAGSQLLVRSGVAGETVTFTPSGFDLRTAEKLALLEPPAQDLTGLLSGDLSTFPVARQPQVQVTLGGDGPHTVSLGSWSDASGAASSLQTAIRGARTSPVFQDAQVVVLDDVVIAGVDQDRLLVRPGVGGQGVALNALAAAPEAFVALGLIPPATDPPTPPAPLANTYVQGVFSGLLAPFPSFQLSEMAVTLDASGPHDVRLEGATSTLAETAQALRAGLRSVAAGPLAASPFASAEVDLLDNRLLVRTATVPLPVTPVTAATPRDPDTVRELAMGPAAQSVYGRLANTLSGAPAYPKPQVQVTVGSRGARLVSLDRVPRDAGMAREALQAGLTAALSGSGVTPEVVLLDDRLLVRAGGETVTFDASVIDPWTADELGLRPPQSEALRGLLSGPVGAFPTFPLPSIEVTLGNRPARDVELASFPQNLEQLRAGLETAIVAASRREPTFTNARVFLLAEPAASRGRLFLVPGVLGDDALVKVSATDPLTAVDIQLTEPPVRTATGLMSGSLLPYPAELQPSVTVTLGGAGSRAVSLGGLPGNLDRAIELLRTALRAAGTDAAWQSSDVTRLGNRILILPGTPGAAVTVTATGSDPMAATLKLLSPEARRIQGRLSGLLTSFPAFARARLQVQIGAAGPTTVELVDLPSTLAEAAAELQEAVRAAGGGTGFTAALVLVYGSRLLVLSGAGNDAVTVTAAAAPDDATAGDLRLLSSQGEAVLASGDLAAFAGLQRPEIQAAFGAASADVTLTALPTDLTTARGLLESALQAAGFSAARIVTTPDSRLLVIGGSAGATPSFAATGDDPYTAGELRLTTAAGAAVYTALVSGSLTPFPSLTGQVKVDVTFGSATGTATLATAPTSLADARAKLEAAIRAITPAAATFSNARVEVAGDQLVVIPGVAGDAPSIAPATGSTAATDLELTAAAGAVARPALLSGSLATFPSPLSVTPAVSVSIGGGAASTRSFATVPANLAEARTALQTALQAAAPAGVTVSVEVVNGQRLLVRAGGATVSVTDAAGRPATASALRLTAAAGGTRGLLSGDLAGFTGLSVMPRIGIDIGGVTATGRFAHVPTSLASARAELQAAIRAAAGGTAFTGAQVEILDDRLLVTPGTPSATVRFTDVSPGPPTATRLSLSDALSMALDGLLSGDGIALPTLSLRAALGTAGTRLLVLDYVPSDLVRLASALQAALRAAGAQAPAAPTFSGASVFTRGNQLVVMAGVASDEVVFTSAGTPDLAALLKLDASRSSVIEGALSGYIAEPPDLRLAPSFFVSLGGEERAAVLATPPTDLASARTLLQAAIRAAAPALPTFSSATVRVLGDRLLVTAGNASDAVAFRDKPAGAAPVTALQLGSGAATPATGLLSGDLAPFPALTAAPRIVVRFGGVERTAVLTELPADLAGYRAALEAAVRAADAAPEFSGATVRLLGGRLLVQPGTRSGLPAVLSDAPAVAGASRPGLATGLGLSPGTSLDGLLSGPLDGFAGVSTSRPRLDVVIDGLGSRTLELSSPPTTIAALRNYLEQALRDADPAPTYRNATVQVVGNRLLITPGVPTDSIFFAAAAGRPDDLTLLRLDGASLVPAGGLLSGPVRPLPALALKMSARLGSQGPRDIALTRFPVSLADAAVVLQDALEDATFANAAVTVVAGRLRIAAPGVLGRDIRFAPHADDGATVFRLRLDDDNAEPADGLLSGDLSDFPKFGLRPLLRVTLGTEGPYQTELGFIPFTPEEARQSLEQAIRNAHATPAFTLARVLRGDGDRLVVVPGRPGQAAFDPDPESPDTASVLKLTPAQGARSVNALLSGPLPPVVPLTAPAPRVRVALRSAGASVADFDAALMTGGGPLASVAATLQAGIRGGAPASPAPASPAASGALVIPFGPPSAPERLLAVPGAEGYGIGFSAAATDAATVAELRFQVSRAVGTASTDEEAGPPLSLVRSTVFGRLVVSELPLASETLFTEPVRVERRHVGCVRYCYLPEGSQTPRRFRCQPDLALAAALHQALETRARELGLAAADGLPAAERDLLEARQRTRVLAALAPRFTSVRFGDPGYGQLRTDNAREILTGAEDGSEIGAMSRLREPLRRRQLLVLLEEYLRFGLDTGLFFLT